MEYINFETAIMVAMVMVMVMYSEVAVRVLSEILRAIVRV